MKISITVDGGGSRCGARLRKGDAAFESSLEEPLNLSGQPLDGVMERLHCLLDRLPAAEPVGSVSVGLAGGVPGQRRGAVEEALRHRYPGAGVAVRRDLDLVLAQLGAVGVVVVVGTGCAAVARAGDDGDLTVDGRGFAIGDRGGGAWIGLRAVRLGLRRFDLEGVETPLLRAVRKDLGLASERGILTALSDERGLSARRLAGLAPVVLALAERLDPDADAIVTKAVAEVTASVDAAARRAGLSLPTKILIAGGLSHAPGFLGRLRTTLLGMGVAKRVTPVDPLDADLVAGPRPKAG